jgi:hypothetical protein
MPAPLVHTGPVSLNVFPPASPRLVLARDGAVVKQRSELGDHDDLPEALP